MDDHDDAEPGPRALYRLERSAVLASRPGKSEPIEADQLRAEWTERARHAGFEALALPDGQHRLPGVTARDGEAEITAALGAVAEASSTWLKADLAREIAARLPAEVASSAVGAVQVVDELAERAVSRCVELHPSAASGAKCRRDGRPITEHVVDRRLSAPAVLDQEARVLAWAGTNVGDVRMGMTPIAATAAFRAFSGPAAWASSSPPSLAALLPTQTAEGDGSRVLALVRVGPWLVAGGGLHNGDGHLVHVPRPA